MHVLHAFSPKNNSFQEAFLSDEAFLFNGITQFDIIDTYLNLTALQLQAYNWTLHHFPVLDYYLRVNTVMHVNIPLPFLLLLHHHHHHHHHVVYRSCENR